jgi:hypothetical protein
MFLAFYSSIWIDQTTTSHNKTLKSILGCQSIIHLIKYIFKLDVYKRVEIPEEKQGLVKLTEE